MVEDDYIDKSEKELLDEYLYRLENNISSGDGMISDGKYEVLLCSMPISEDGYICGDFIQYLNNAAVKNIVDLKHKVDWNEKGRKINEISFTMPRDEDKLGEIFSTTPYGLLKKNRTGVGATTLELNSERNSIIVVPTKALAYNKAKKSKIKNSKKYGILYVGGKITGFNPPQIREYLVDDEIKYKKFLVVADSLPKLLREIGEGNYDDYFLMVDEIDSYQYDSTYRPALESVIDYYFLFPKIKRSLVSATIGTFSDKRIEDEPVINVMFNQPQPRKIDLLHTNNVIEVAAEQIKSTIEKYPDDKILIAYNAVRRGIIHLIESLSEELKKDCAVLCGNDSIQYVKDYYSDITEEVLPQKITFMTCTYFVGIDISEQFHLISIADSRYSHTLLSEDKLQQISGRCRHEKGLLSETIIYSTKEKDEVSHIGASKLTDKIVNEALSLIDFADKGNGLVGKFGKLLDETIQEKLNNNAIVESSKMRLNDLESVKVLREDIENKLTPAYFNIDNMLIQNNLLCNLYSNIEMLRKSLEAQGNSVSFKHIKAQETPKEVLDAVKQNIEEKEEDEINDIIEKLRVECSAQDIQKLINSSQMNITKNGKKFIQCFIELQKYVDFEELVSILPQKYKSQSEYNKFYNSVIFWALSDEHPFKIAFLDKFPLKETLADVEVVKNVNDLMMSYFGFKELNTNQTYDILGLFVKKGKRSKDKFKRNCYPIDSYDVNDFGIAPINEIPSNADLLDYFRFDKRYKK